MRFELKIESGNATYTETEGSSREAIARHLEDAARRLRDGDDVALIRDPNNGQSVGSWFVEY